MYSKLSSKLTARKVFLLDGIGAALSAFLLGVVLPLCQPWIGMPKLVLFVLALPAVGLAKYSLSRYRKRDISHPIWLKTLVVANLSYCVLSTFFVLTYWKRLTTLGLAYFSLEIAVVLLMVAVEYTVLSKLPPGADDFHHRA